MQTIEINETLVLSMSWWDVVDDLACFGLHVVLIGVLSTVMIGAMLVALNPATQFPNIPWAFSGVMALLLAHRMVLFLIVASELNILRSDYSQQDGPIKIDQ